MTRAGSAVAGIPTLSDRDDVPPLNVSRISSPVAPASSAARMATNARSVQMCARGVEQHDTSADQIRWVAPLVHGCGAGVVRDVWRAGWRLWWWS